MHPVTIAEIEKFLIQGGLVTTSEWERLSQSSQVQGVMHFQKLVKELQELPCQWEADDQQSRLTTLHRKLLLRLSEGRSLSYPGVRVGNFLLLEPMGTGGQGKAFKASEIVPSIPGKRGKVRLVKTGKPGDRRLHEREVEILKRLNLIRCPRVPRFYASGVDRTHPYLVMSFRPGGDLRKYIKKNGPLPVNLAIHITRKLIDTLRTAHQAGILHRDIKPSNLIFNPKTIRVSVIDWGLGTVPKNDSDYPDPFGEAPQLSHSATKLGTFTWMSPEHFRSSSDIVPASDMYALACVLFYMLTGEPPFRGSPPELTYHHAHSPRPLVSERKRLLGQPHYKQVPLQVDQLVQQLMSVEASRRPGYDTCLEILDDALTRPKSAVPSRPRKSKPVMSAKPQLESATATDQDDTDEGSLKHEPMKDQQDRFSKFPERTSPKLVNPDFIFGALPSFYDMTQMKWPEMSFEDGREFTKTLQIQRDQFNSEENAQKSASLQKLAFEKARYENFSIAIEQWQTAWLWTPWDTTLKRHYLNVMREQAARPRSISLNIPKPSGTMRQGNALGALQACEATLARNPWSTEALWQEAMIFDLLGYWNACNNTIELLIKTHFEFQERPIPLLILSARVAAKVSDFKRARKLLNAITTIDDRYARSSEFHDLVNGIEAEMHTLMMQRQ